jgi:hypothetical protein
MLYVIMTLIIDKNEHSFKIYKLLEQLEKLELFTREKE